MILLPVAALVIGFMLFYWPSQGFEADEALARYTAIAVLAGLDTVLGGLRARLTDQYDDAIFISGFFANTILAGALVLLGEKLGLEAGIGDQRVSAMMIAAVVVSAHAFSTISRFYVVLSSSDGAMPARDPIEYSPGRSVCRSSAVDARS
jgi:small basic protein